MPYIAVSPRYIVHRPPDIPAPRVRNVLPAERGKIAVKISLDKLYNFVVHLFAAVVQKLYSVVVIGVVARRNHNPAIEPVATGYIRNGRGSRHVQYVSVAPRRSEPHRKCVFQHIRRKPRILAYNGAALAVFRRRIVPAKHPADLVSVFGCNSNARFAPEPVRSEIFFRHNSPFSDAIRVAAVTAHSFFGANERAGICPVCVSTPMLRRPFVTPFFNGGTMQPPLI